MRFMQMQPAASIFSAAAGQPRTLAAAPTQPFQ